MSGAKEQVAPQASQSWRIVGSVARGGGLPIVSPRPAAGGRWPTSGKPCSTDADKSRSQRQRIRRARFDLRLPFLQRKLTVGAVDDPLEREADSVADAVMFSGTLRLDPIATSSLSSRDFLPDYWRKCQARVAKALKKRDRAAAEQAVNGFKKVVADRVAATKAKLDKLDEERGKVSETLRSHPALVPKGARIAAGNLLVREMTFFDLLDKHGKLVEGLEASQKPSLDAVKPWAFDPKMRFPYQE